MRRTTLARRITMTLTVAFFTAKASAQTPITSPRSNLLFAPSAEVSASAEQSTAPFLQTVLNATPIQRPRNGTASIRKDCPMPIHRPDTSRTERMPVAQPSPSVNYSMPRAELKCFNPLDQSK
jgi:hypothetical protein